MSEEKWEPVIPAIWGDLRPEDVKALSEMLSEIPVIREPARMCACGRRRKCNDGRCLAGNPDTSPWGRQ